jgi:positive regulator of sigma E activity
VLVRDIARLMGPTFVAIALGMLIDLGMYESMIAEALHTGVLFYLSGLLSLLAGLAMINLHNMWRADWRVIFTILGWLMTIGGIMRIVMPQVAVAIDSTVYGGRASTIAVALVTGALGAFLSFKGYMRRARSHDV